jgi:uncharacterized protein YceK
MKSLVFKILAALALATSLAGCGSIMQESANDWMMHQPVDLDD